MCIPLTMMIIIHQQFISETNEWADQQQVEITKSWSSSIADELHEISLSASRLAAIPFPSAEQAAKVVYGPGIVNIRNFYRTESETDASSLTNLRTTTEATGTTRMFIPGCSGEHCIELEIDADAVLSSVWKEIPSKQIQGHLADEDGRVIYATSGSADKRVLDSSIFDNLQKGTPYWRTVEPRNVGKIVSAAPVEGTNFVVVTEYPILERDELLRRSLSMSGFLIVLSIFGSIVAGFAASRPLAKSIELLNEGVSSMKSGTPVEIAEKITQCGGPVELVRFGERFESMAEENREKSDSLKTLTAELEERVAERTERLRRRNAELRAVHYLLAPFQGSAFEGIKYAADRIRQVNKLDVLSFISSNQSIPKDCTTFPVRLNGTTFGFIAAKSDGDLEESVKSSINLLADSIAIVLSNNQLLVSITRAQDTLRTVLSSMTDGVALLSITNGRLLYSNRIFKQLFNLTSHAKRSFDKILPSRFVSLHRIEEGGRSTKLDMNLDSLQTSGVYHLTTDGRQKQTLELRTFPIQTGLLAQQGRGIGIVVRDVSEEVYLSQMKE